MGGEGFYLVFQKEKTMSKIILKVKQFLRDQDGVTAIEYGLIASLIGVAIIGGAYTVGTDLNSVFNKIGGDL